MWGVWHATGETKSSTWLSVTTGGDLNADSAEHGEEPRGGFVFFNCLNVPGSLKLYFSEDWRWQLTYRHVGIRVCNHLSWGTKSPTVPPHLHPWPSDTWGHSKKQPKSRSEQERVMSFHKILRLDLCKYVGVKTTKLWLCRHTALSIYCKWFVVIWRWHNYVDLRLEQK